MVTLPRLSVGLYPFHFPAWNWQQVRAEHSRAAELPDQHLRSSLSQWSCDLRCTQNRALLKQVFNILRENSLFTECAITLSELYAKINPKILMKIQKKKKKRQHSSVPREYIIHKFKIQALPSYA